MCDFLLIFEDGFYGKKCEFSCLGEIYSLLLKFLLLLLDLYMQRMKCVE